METCTFFGHSDAPQNIRPILRAALVELIECKGVKNFLVGNHGSFDSMVRAELTVLQSKYPHIRFCVVLAYLPAETTAPSTQTDTLFPEGLEKTPPRYAIDKRNRWMIDNADCVLTYVTHSFGGAAKFKEIAAKKRENGIQLMDFA